jgi:hypothetical protein
MSITFLACTTFPIEEKAFSLAFFTSRLRQAKALLSTGAPIALQPGRSPILGHCFPQPRDAIAVFSSPPHCHCILDFLDKCDTIKIVFFCYYDF